MDPLFKSYVKGVAARIRLMRQNGLSDYSYLGPFAWTRIHIDDPQDGPRTDAIAQKTVEQHDLDYILAPFNGIYYPTPEGSRVPYVHDGQLIDAGTIVGRMVKQSRSFPVKVERPVRVVHQFRGLRSAVKMDDVLLEVDYAVPRQ